MEDIFQGGFYTDTLFSEDFVEDSLDALVELPLNSLVKYRESEFPATVNATQYHEISSSYSCAVETPKSQNSTHAHQNGKTIDALQEMDEICLAGDAANNTWNANVVHAEGRTAHARGQPLKKMRRLRANDRERRRMRSLNRALESLKKCLPVPQSKRRVTKLEILRIACNYIRSLSDTLSEDSRSSDGATRGKKSRSRGIVSDPVVNGFSVAQRLEILSGNNTNRI